MQLQAVRALVVTLLTLKQIIIVFKQIKLCSQWYFSKVWKQFLKSNTSLYLKNMALGGPNLVFWFPVSLMCYLGKN